LAGSGVKGLTKSKVFRHVIVHAQGDVIIEMKIYVLLLVDVCSRNYINIVF